MPIYEFVCSNCGWEFERIQSFSATSTPRCPSCDSEQVVRRMGLPAIHFKGSGWYSVDSKNDAKSNGKVENAGEKEGSEVESDAKQKNESDSTVKTSGDSASEGAPAKAAKSESKQSSAQANDVKQSATKRANKSTTDTSN